jgi:hypothetical protein
MFDGDYLKTQKTWIKNKLDGIGYAADHHYSVGRKFDGNVFCHVAMASSENSLPPKYSARCRKHSITTKEYSKCIKQLRGCVESPFGWVKYKWKSLNRIRRGARKAYLLHCRSSQSRYSIKKINKNVSTVHFIFGSYGQTILF